MLVLLGTIASLIAFIAVMFLAADRYHQSGDGDEI